jgi:DNA-binding NarL/FixJ family response regulator
VNILWVENHPQFARLAIRRFLAAHAVTVVPSLSAARAALAAGRFDAVLVDFDLDDGKGDELVRDLQQSRGGPWVVATSSHEAGNRALTEAGADAVCAKMQFAQIGAVLVGLAGTAPD